MLGGSFDDPSGNSVPITEDGFVLASWENGLVASRMAHGESFEELQEEIPGFTQRDYNDYLSRFEAGALIEGYKVQNSTPKATEIYNKVKDYDKNTVIDVNIGQDGYTGTSSFITAGPSKTLNLPEGLSLSGGTVLTAPNNTPAANTTLYGTALTDDSANLHADPSLSATISFTFQQPINSLLVQVLNGRSDERTYSLTSDKGDSTQIDIDSNSNLGVGTLFLHNTNGSTHFEISSTQSPWDFFIGDIKFTKSA